ncbi:MAG: hypothetical protein EKK42_20115 [Pseudonocardiaceae bacterium]|nr:MAG: hypothetical protein EKK42_20115 [Pseudonocardiaceae bacterium]
MLLIDLISPTLQLNRVHMVEFVAWEKTPRYFRDIVITEKIDGVTTAVVIEQHYFGTHVDGIPSDVITLVCGPNDETGTPEFEYTVSAQSRKRLITPESDNHGFAKWVSDNASSLVRDLGAGRHFGEWWGSGINRGYGLTNGVKVFSLFNTRKWFGVDEQFETPNLTVVPVLFQGDHDMHEVDDALDSLRDYGSAATVDFDGSEYRNPEGVCIFHTAANRVFKVTLEDDAVPKVLAAAA